MTDGDNVMLTGKARWLLEGGLDELDDDTRALLLALVTLEADSGRALSDEERAALDQMIARSGADGEQIARAVKQMIKAKPRPSRRLDWSALTTRRRRS